MQSLLKHFWDKQVVLSQAHPFHKVSGGVDIWDGLVLIESKWAPQLLEFPSKVVPALNQNPHVYFFCWRWTSFFVIIWQQHTTSACVFKPEGLMNLTTGSRPQTSKYQMATTWQVRIAQLKNYAPEINTWRQHTTFTCAFKPKCLMSHNWLLHPKLYGTKRHHKRWQWSGEDMDKWALCPMQAY